MASVLGELGTGVFPVSVGVPGGYIGPAKITQELSRRAGRPAIYNLLTQELNKLDEWREHLHMVDEAFKSGTRAYASCLSATAGPIFDLRAGLGGLEDEDMISPTTVFQGMPTWDAVMGQPVEERIRSLDSEVRKALSWEGVEPEGAHRFRMDRGTRTMSFTSRWDSVQVYMAFEERNRKHSGKIIEQLADEHGKGIMDAFLDLVLDYDLRITFQVIDRYDDPNCQREILGSPDTVIGTTDGGARPDKGDRTTYSTDLLSRWVREEGVMTLEDAVYRSDRQDRADARPARPRLYSGWQSGRHRDRRSRYRWLRAP